MIGQADLEAPLVHQAAPSGQNDAQNGENAVLHAERGDNEGVDPEQAMIEVNGYGPFQMFALVVMAMMWGCGAMQMSSYVLFALPLNSADSKNTVTIHMDGMEIHLNGAPLAEECALQHKHPITIEGDDLIAHFGLICERGHLVPVLGSALFFGGAFGVLLFSWLSDKIGRGLTLRIILVGMVLSNVCAVFAQGIYMYIAAKAFVGLCGISGGAVVYAYFSEVSGGEVAKKGGTNGSNGGYAVGLLFLVGLGMWTQNWRTMEVVICAIGLIICIASFFLPESPRWLVTAGRGEDAREAFAVIARWNGTTAPTKIAVVQKQEKSAEDGCRCKVELFTGWSGTHLFFLGGLYLIMNVGYYGFSAASAELGSAYVSLAWVAISGTVAFYVVAECYQRYGKRITNVVCFTSAAFFSMLCIFCSDLPRQIFAGAGLFFVTMVFSGIYQYTNELFTTSMRGSANGVCGFIGKYLIFAFSIESNFYFFLQKASLFSKFWFPVESLWS